MRFLLILSIIPIAFAFFHSLLFQSLSIQNYTPEQANSIINSAFAYVNAINESGYILFYPSLDKAYAYLNNATKLCNSSPSIAIEYALKAKQIAANEESRLESYRLVSFIIMLAFTIAMLFILYTYMKPVKQKGRKQVRTAVH
jgi:uncharacterized BrkB/YihY/UPF0761 family membrane protein